MPCHSGAAPYQARLRRTACLPPPPDLKPANVLLKGVRSSVRGFQCKLGDFGLSRWAGAVHAWARHGRSVLAW